MEEILKQLIVELKRLNDTVGRIDERLKKLECSGQAMQEIDRCINVEEGLFDNIEALSASEDLGDMWRKVLDIIKKELSEVSFKTWLEIIKPLSIDKDVLHLGVLSEFEKGIIECRYSALLKTALRSITNRDFEIELSVIGYEKKEAVLNKEITTEADKKWSSLNPKYSFSTFVVGEHNKSAYKHVFEIKRPDLDTRLEILRRRRAEENMQISDEELSSIADSTSDNVRELINAFNRFVTQTGMAGEQIE